MRCILTCTIHQYVEALTDLLTLRCLTHLDIEFESDAETVQEEVGRILAPIRSLRYIRNRHIARPHESWSVIEREDDGGYIGLRSLGFMGYGYSWGGHYGGLADVQWPPTL